MTDFASEFVNRFLLFSLIYIELLKKDELISWQQKRNVAKQKKTFINPS